MNDASINDGIGWSTAWTTDSGAVTNSGTSLSYPATGGTSQTTNGNSLVSTVSSTVTRDLTDNYGLFNEVFYISYLVKWNTGGSVELKGFATDGDPISPSSSVKLAARLQSDGAAGMELSARANSYGTPTSVALTDGDTYLIVLQRNGGTTNVKLYQDTDVIPTDYNSIVWDATASGNSGLNLYRLQFVLNNVEVDELRLGSTFASVTQGDGANYPSVKVITSTTPSETFLYDGIDGDVLTNTKGIGWSRPWRVTEGSGALSTGSGLSFSSTTNSLTTAGSSIVVSDASLARVQRDFANKYELGNSSFYVSYLVKINSGGNIRFDGISGSDIRFGLNITDTGSLVLRAGAQESSPVSNVVSDDGTTYLVVIKKFGNGVNSAKVYANGSSIPVSDTSVTWDVSETGATGVDLDLFKFSLRNAEVDELRLGAKWEDVTPQGTLNVLSTRLPEFKLYPNPASDVVTIKGVQEEVKVQILDMSGSPRSFTKKVNSVQNEITLDISTLKKGIYIIDIQGPTVNNSQKLIVN
jgi:hypothetical protein